LSVGRSISEPERALHIVNPRMSHRPVLTSSVRGRLHQRASRVGRLRDTAPCTPKYSIGDCSRNAASAVVRPELLITVDHNHTHRRAMLTTNVAVETLVCAFAPAICTQS
jgi:hypothetical protein